MENGTRENLKYFKYLSRVYMWFCTDLSYCFEFNNDNQFSLFRGAVEKVNS